MSYLALYRKYRPINLSEVIGQEHIVKTLVNQIENDRIGHAYLFCGPRGTGKTSTAKIFAKAINCQNNKNGEPCGKCNACKALSDASNLDILEIDAASNNRVDEIRDLREKVQYPPVSVKYKVYIIDEVHMLTDQAFNALLKTLEEPPMHAIFILATTEVQKLPATILSRCMRFDFKLIPLTDIAEHIKIIFTENNKDFEDEAVLEIARAGGGSVRDSLSIADICLSYSNEKLTYKDVLEVLGGTDFDNIYSLVNNILACETGNALNDVNQLILSGKSINVLSRDIISFLRNLLIANTCRNANEILSMPEDYYNKLKTLSENYESHRILRCMEIFSESDSSLKYSSNPKIIFESSAVKASMPEKDFNFDALFARITELEKNIKTGTIGKIVKVEDKPKNETLKEKTEIKKIETITAETIVTETTQALEPIEVKKTDKSRVWGLFINLLRKNREVILYTICAELSCGFEGDKIIINATSKTGYNALNKPEYKEKIKNTLSELGYNEFEIILIGETSDAFEQDLKELKKNFENINIKITEV
jgi:DNA polymerase-3 subunit gamma/tau